MKRTARLVLGVVGALLAAACAKSLSDLEPYPCANDGTCPDGRACTVDKKCLPAHLDSACVVGRTDCTTATADGRCSVGVCGQPCDGNRLDCPTGRICSVQPGAGGEGACLHSCATQADCPAPLVCRELDVRGGAVVRACVGPTDTSILGASCKSQADCKAQGATLTCYAGTCARPCSQSADCGPGFVCPVGGGGCLRDCSVDGTCDSDQSCAPLWRGGLRGCVGKDVSLPSCSGGTTVFICDGMCGTTYDQRACSAGGGNTCPSGAACMANNKCANCATARHCGVNGAACTTQTPCDEASSWWCAPKPTDANCNGDISKLVVNCKCLDGRELVSGCGSTATCEQRCQDECDLLAQDCKEADKQKCTTVPDGVVTHNACVALAASPKKEGEPCERTDPEKVGIDDCDKGLYCSTERDGAGVVTEYRCRKFCSQDLGGCAAGEVCSASDETINPNDNSALCRRACSYPNGTECGPGAHCSITGACVAGTTYAGDLETECLTEYNCKQGLTCDLTRNRCIPTCDPPRRLCPTGYECARSADAGAPADGGLQRAAYCVKN